MPHSGEEEDMADATITTGLLSTRQTKDEEKLAARRHFIRERQLTADEARDLWDFGGDAEAMALFRALSPKEQAAKKAVFLKRPVADEQELRSWCESIDQGNWPTYSQLKTQMNLDELKEDAAIAKDELENGANFIKQDMQKLDQDAQQAETELDPAWVKLMETTAAKEAKLANARRNSKKTQKRAKKAQARSNSEPKTAAPASAPITPPTKAPAEVTKPIEPAVQAAPVEKTDEQRLDELNEQLAQTKNKAEKRKIMVEVRAILNKEHEARRKFQAKKDANQATFGMVCSHPECCYGLQEHNRWVPAIDEMSADLGRDVQIQDLESFVVCRRHTDGRYHRLAKTAEILSRRDIRRAQENERQAVIKAELEARAQKRAQEQQAAAERQARLDFLKLRSRGKFTCDRVPFNKVGTHNY